jgi:hypothetical protein
MNAMNTTALNPAVPGVTKANLQTECELVSGKALNLFLYATQETFHIWAIKPKKDGSLSRVYWYPPEKVDVAKAAYQNRGETIAGMIQTVCTLEVKFVALLHNLYLKNKGMCDVR